jgi:hypothetical protein
LRVLLAEDLLILLAKRVNVDPPRLGGTQAALAAALLLELAKAGRLGVDRDGAGRLHVFADNRSLSGDALFDNALAAVAAADGGLVADVVQAVVPGLHVNVLDRLAERGVLTARSRIGIWRLADCTRRDQLRAWLADVLLDRIAPDWGSGALISLLHMVYATSVVVDGRSAAARATAIADGDWPADETTKAIADDCAKIVLHWTSGGGGTITTTTI